MSGTVAPPPAIQFSRIPANNLVPLFFVEFSAVNGNPGLSQQPTLLIGQSAATPPSGYNVPVPISTVAQARAQFGARSMLGRMCSVYLAQDNQGPLYAFPVTAATGSATGSIAFTGPATLPGYIPLEICGIDIPVNVNIGDTATTIGANAAIAITNTLDLPINASSSAGTVTLTAIHPGAQGNNIDIRLAVLGVSAAQSLPQGVGVTITPMTGGGTDPTLGTVAGAIGDQLFDFIAHPYAGATQLANITALMNDATGRWAWDRQDYGHVFTMQPGTESALQTTGGTINDQHQTIVGVNGSPSPPWDWAADWTGAVAVSAKALASRPLQTLSMQTCLSPVQSNWWNYAAEQALLSVGIAVPSFSTYAKPQILRSVTTYQFNAYGVTDQTYIDVETMYTLMAITRQLKAALTTKYPRSILAPSGTPSGPGGVVVTPNDIKAELIAQYNIMQAAGLVTSAAQMIAGTVVQINAQNPTRCDILWTPVLAQGLRMFGINNQFSL